MTMVRLQRTAEELRDLIVADVRRTPGCEDFDARFAIEHVPDFDFGYRTWDVGPVTLREPCLTPFREAVDRLRRRFDLWPWPEPSEPAHGTTPSF
jgi:hypothetical protein